LLASAGLGAGVGVGTYYAMEAQIQPIVAHADEVEEQIESEETSEEEKADLQDILNAITEKYYEIKNLQIAGTTLGAIVGAILGAVVSMIPALMNRSNIKKAIETVGTTKVIVDSNTKLAKELKDQCDINNANYDKAISEMEGLGKDLGDLKGVLSNTLDELDGVKKENALIHEENRELKDILLTMASHSKELVACGVAEALNKKYNKEN